MPYLEYLFCERCGDHARIDIDFVETIKAYNRDGRPDTSMNQAALVWDYLVYSCGICGSKYLYTYRDVEKRVREFLSSLSQEHKEYFDKMIEGAEKRKPIVSEIKKRIEERYTHK